MSTTITLQEIIKLADPNLELIPVLCAPEDAELPQLGLPEGAIVVLIPREHSSRPGWIPQGYIPLGSGEQVGKGGISEISGLAMNTIRDYTYKKQLPPPDGYIARSPWWWRYTIESWMELRFGTGTT